MRVIIKNLWTNSEQAFDGEPGEVLSDISNAFPHAIHDHTRNNLDEMLAHINQSQIFSVRKEKDIPLKDSEVIDQMGIRAIGEEFTKAARFLSGSTTQFSDSMLAEDDIFSSILQATDCRASKQEVLNLSLVMKAEPTPVTPPSSILPLSPRNKSISDGIKRAFISDRVQNIYLGGKHSKGSMLATDPQSHAIWLLKPDIAGKSPAKGLADQEGGQEQASREAGMYEVAKVIGLQNFVSKSTVIFLDGIKFAAIHFLDKGWKNLEKMRQADPESVARILKPYCRNGDAYKWAILDAICGNVDRHAGNYLVGPQGQIRLIDGGSAFASDTFDPHNDKAVFTPFAIRYQVPNWSKLTVQQKLSSMIDVSPDVDNNIRHFVSEIDKDQVRRAIEDQGLDAEPSLKRLYRLQRVALDCSRPFHLYVNEFWVGV